MMGSYACTGSLILYRNPPSMVRRAVESFLRSDLPARLYVVDNSPSDALRPVLADLPAEYQWTGCNLGYGRGHNRIIRDRSLMTAPYHVIMNPDIWFDETTLSRLRDFMERNPEIGMVMPKILYPDHSIQHLCKLLPTPFDLIARRFMPGWLKPMMRKRLDRYECRDKNYDTVMDVPNLSGCFLFLRTPLLQSLDGFDDRFFMYLEDTDLCKRVGARSRTVYYPHATVIHEYAKGSYGNKKLMWHHMSSAVKYFNKWGWCPLW